MDYRLFRAINNATGNPVVDTAMKVAGRYAIFIAAVVVAVLCVLRWRRGDRFAVLATGSTLVVAYLFGLLDAATYSEKRPFQTHHVHLLLAHAPGQSFPSDHATAAFAFALAALVFLSRRWGVALFLLALLIGFARVYAGVHYPGDIAGSLLAAVVGVTVTWTLSHRWRGSERASQLRFS